jgi:hypothetical protein
MLLGLKQFEWRQLAEHHLIAPNLLALPPSATMNNTVSAVMIL